MSSSEYKNKYLKYKNKYLRFKQTGGGRDGDHVYFVFSGGKTDCLLTELYGLSFYTLKIVSAYLNNSAYKLDFNKPKILEFVHNNNINGDKIEYINHDKYIKNILMKTSLSKFESTPNLLELIKLINDQINKPEVKPEVKPEAKSEVKPEVKPEVKDESKPEVKPEIGDVLYFSGDGNGTQLRRHLKVNNNNGVLTIEEVPVQNVGVPFEFESDKVDGSKTRRPFFHR